MLARDSVPGHSAEGGRDVLTHQDQLRRPARGVVVGRPAAAEHRACTPNGQLPDLPGLVDQLTPRAGPNPDLAPMGVYMGR